MAVVAYQPRPIARAPEALRDVRILKYSPVTVYAPRRVRLKVVR